MWPFLITIIVPGYVQFYFGKNIRALIMLIIAVTPLYPGAVLWSIVDGIKLKEKGYAPQVSRKEPYYIIGALIVGPIIILIMLKGAISLWGIYDTRYAKPKATLSEGKEIVRIVNKYFNVNGKYPENLQSLIRGNPLRSKWKTDSWGEQYFYKVEGHGQSFVLKSTGKDKILDTEDDIIFE